MFPLYGTATVAPVRERGLKSVHRSAYSVDGCRSRKGAWIEILTAVLLSVVLSVAPVRERGLK